MAVSVVEQNVSLYILMALWGWSSYDAIEPYLAAPTEQNIIESMPTALQWCVLDVQPSVDWHTCKAQRLKVSIEP